MRSLYNLFCISNLYALSESFRTPRPLCIRILNQNGEITDGTGRCEGGTIFGPTRILLGGDLIQPWESLSYGYEAGKFSPPNGPFDRVWDWLVSREDAKTRRTTRGRSFVSARRPVPCAIRPVDSIGNERVPPTDKVGWIPRQESQMGLGSPSLRAFAASRESRSELLEVLRAKNLFHLGFFRIAMEFKVSRSSYHLQVA